MWYGHNWDMACRKQDAIHQGSKPIFQMPDIRNMEGVPHCRLMIVDEVSLFIMFGMTLSVSPFAAFYREEPRRGSVSEKSVSPKQHATSFPHISLLLL